MTAIQERAPITYKKESASFDDVVRRIPDAIRFARVEAEHANIAKTPEGTFTLTYLLATRNLLRPVLADLNAVHPDFLKPTGGQEYNPERTIDAIGAFIALDLADHTTAIPHFWMRTEESARWESIGQNGNSVEEGERFAVIDPLDATSGIPAGIRTQTSGIAIYDRQGNLKSAGIVSLVDDGFVFIENVNGTLSVYPEQLSAQYNTAPVTDSLRIGALNRRMHTLRSLPLFTEGHGQRSLDNSSGYATLALIQGRIDAITDPVKGSPWYENVIWLRVAQALGYPVTDKDNIPVDIAAIVRKMITNHEGDSFRNPFIVSRTPDIHQKVLSLITPKTPGTAK